MSETPGTITYSQQLQVHVRVTTEGTENLFHNLDVLNATGPQTEHKIEY